MKNVLFCFLFSLACTNVLSAQTSERIVLVTTDGLRWQELFTGADETLVANKKFHSDSNIAKVYWRTTPEERRATLMPFVWGKIAKMGTIHGNRLKGSLVNVQNKMWFSYPGYNELLTGKPDDQRINSNNKFYNPNKTILEELNENPTYKGSVAAFTGWDVFPYIINDKRSGVLVNAAYTKAQGKQLTEVERFLNGNLWNLPTLFGPSVRLDAMTHGYAIEYMKRAHPKVIYIAYAETDDFAHEGHYPLYLHSAQSVDAFLEQLWNYTQQDPFYKGKTTFIFTTDHGRGTAHEWTSHGSKIAGADEVWMITYGAGVKAAGEVTQSEQLYHSYVVKEIKRVLQLK